MSDQHPTATPAPGPALSPKEGAGAAPEPTFVIPVAWKVAMAAAVIMVVLALVGVGLSNADPRLVETYWICLVPIYGLLCVAAAWRKASKVYSSKAILTQFLHWLGIALAVGVDYWVRGSSVETGTAAGLNAMLLLALGCYLAGVHLEPLFAVVGVVLSLIIIVVAKFDQYMWLIFVVGAAAIVAMIIFERLFRGARSPKAEAGKLSPAAPAGS
jgi:hypothetical protein